MQARYYDPVIGRFYSNDPIGFTGEIDTFNRYSYVANNPYKYTDPTGMSKDFDEQRRQREKKQYDQCERDSNCTNLIKQAFSEKNKDEDVLIASKVRGQKKLTAGQYNTNSNPNEVKKAMNEEKAKNGSSKHFRALKGLLKVIMRGGSGFVPFLLVQPEGQSIPGYDSQGQFIGFPTLEECIAAKHCA